MSDWWEVAQRTGPAPERAIIMTIKTLALLLTLGALMPSAQAGAAPKRPPRQAAPAKPKASPTEVRLAQVRQYAAGIKLGTPRSLVIRLFPTQDGGLTSSSLARYYAGDGVMVDVPYDDHGGSFSAQNRVNGPLRVYRSSFHID